MKLFTSQMVLVSLGLGVGLLIKPMAAERAADPNAPEVVARLHLAGPAQEGSQTEGRTFKEIWRLPATLQLRNDSLDKLAARLAAQFQPNDNNNQIGSCARLIRPLLNDLGESELCVEVIEPSRGTFESTLAVRLDEARGALWRTNWSQILSGWTLRPDLRTERITTLATNSWFAVHCTSDATTGAGAEPQPNSALAKLRQGGRPVAEAHDFGLNLEADLARCAQWLAQLERPELPRLDLTVSGRKEYLRSEARLQFPKPIAARIEKWDIPLNTIRDPLISFTAVQGLNSWLQRQPFFQDLGLDKAPNQLFFWGLSQTAFQIQAAAAVPDARAAFNRIAEQWLPKFNRTLAEHAVGTVIRLPDRVELVWRGLPLLVPYLGTAQDGGKGFLHAGLFPVDPPTNAPPPQLFQQLTSQTNLLFYNWEITEARLAQLRPMLQVGAMFLTVSPMSTNSSASKWLDAIEPRLGNTITEVSMPSPREVHLLRTSHAGLNGLELLTLANWLEGTNFPKVNLKVQFQPVVKSSRQRQKR